MLFFESPCLAVLGFQVCVNFRLVGEVISESRMYLRQRQVTKFPDDFFWNEAHVMPLSDPANGNTRPGNARPAAANLGTARDEAAYLGHGCHRFRV
jgi:hypothetical protein